MFLYVYLCSYIRMYVLQDKPNEMSYLGCKIGHNGEYTYTPPATINEVSTFAFVRVFMYVRT